MKKIVFLCASFVGNSILGDNNGDPLSFINDGDRLTGNSRSSESFERTKDALLIIPSDTGTFQDTQMTCPSPTLPVHDDSLPHGKPFPIGEQHPHQGEDEEDKKTEEVEDEDTDEKKIRSREMLQKVIQDLQDPALILGIQNCSSLDQLEVFTKAACSALLAVQKRQETIA